MNSFITTKIISYIAEGLGHEDIFVKLARIGLVREGSDSDKDAVRKFVLALSAVTRRYGT